MEGGECPQYEFTGKPCKCIFEEDNYARFHLHFNRYNRIILLELQWDTFRVDTNMIGTHAIPPP